MPMTNVCASTPATSSVVAARPTAGVRRAKCQPYATKAAAYRARGTKCMNVDSARRRRTEIPLLRARHGVGTIGANHHAPPRAVAPRVLRRVAHRVLARQLVGNLPVDVRELAHFLREECAAARFLGQLPE